MNNELGNGFANLHSSDTFSRSVTKISQDGLTCNFLLKSWLTDGAACIFKYFLILLFIILRHLLAGRKTNREREKGIKRAHAQPEEGEREIKGSGGGAKREREMSIERTFSLSMFVPVMRARNQEKKERERRERREEETNFSLQGRLAEKGRERERKKEKQNKLFEQGSKTDSAPN